jgi:hypothetical protein
MYAGGRAVNSEIDAPELMYSGADLCAINTEIGRERMLHSSMEW